APFTGRARSPRIRRSAASADELADVLELVVDHRLLEGAGWYARQVLASPAREILRLARQSTVLVRHREARLALDGLHQDLEGRVRRRQGAGNLDRPGEIAVANNRDVADKCPPDLAIVLEVEAADRVRGAGGRRRQRGAG